MINADKKLKDEVVKEGSTRCIHTEAVTQESYFEETTFSKSCTSAQLSPTVSAKECFYFGKKKDDGKAVVVKGLVAECVSVATVVAEVTDIVAGPISEIAASVGAKSGVENGTLVKSEGETSSSANLVSRGPRTDAAR